MAIDDLITDPALLPLLDTSHSTLAQALRIVDWLSQTTQSDPTTLDQQLELSRLRKTLHSHLAKLRGQSRRAAYGARDTKSQTAEARQEVDRLLLQLQNLYYEQQHLLGEIGMAEGYDHAFARLPILSLSEYFDLFPDQNELSEQELMPKRIEHERQQREELEAQRLELVKVKEGLLKENARRKEELKKMDERLEGIVDGLKTVEEELAKEL